MNVAVFGASGMVGRGVLLQSLDQPSIQRVLSVGRRGLDIDHPKLTELLHDDFLDFAPIADQLRDLDACFWCLGTASGGVDEETYTRITYDFTMAAADTLLASNPNLCFCFVSGAGTDETEEGRAMWARVKGKTENALKGLDFGALYLFRPGFILPRRGARPRGALYRVMNVVALPFYPLLRVFGAGTSNVEIGDAMIAAALGMADKQTLHSRDINQLAARLSQPDAD